jgi:HAE1 family hydrophobic/amphiphilic exporter-1
VFSKFFIYRPIFASVVSIVIVLAGSITIPFLPVEQTPNITPPTVEVKAKYPGASATVIADTVAAPIEKEVNGVENMIYMSSKSSDDGTMTLTVTFEVGTDIDMATVLTQNRVAIAEPFLPEEVRREGITTKKKSTNIVLMVNLLSPDGQYDEIYQSNYVNTQIKDVLSRVPGVGEVMVFGAKDFGMRVWLDPEKLKARSLTTNDVVSAIREQNVQVAAGQIGAPPSPAGQEFQYTVNAMGRLTDVEQFENIILKVDDEGGILRVRDVARVELGAQSYNWFVELNGAPSIAMGIYQLPGANALDVADGVRAAMDRLAERFPEGLQYTIAYDTTKFITASIKEVITTLFVAVILVILTVYVFLQDLRTTLIPALTIPVSLLGTFAVMAVMGLSINTLSLFGLVLAIGIVVDDAIVVVENAMRIMDEEGLERKEATVKAMGQITGPVIATTLVLLAVFVPTAMLGGITGRLYQQFALTIATATVFSSINALTLSPALCGMLLRPTPESRGFIFNAFNRVFDASTNGYMAVVNAGLRKTAVAMVIWLIFAGLMVYGFRLVPTGFIPDEDQGYILANAQLPDGATLERTGEVIDRMSGILQETPGVADAIAIGGYSLLDAVVTPNSGAMFIMLDPWEERTSADLQVDAILHRFGGELAQIQEAVAFPFNPPPIQGLGTAGGFEYQLQDRGGAGIELVEMVSQDLVFEGNAHPVLTRMNSSMRASVPQLYLDVDRVKAKTLGVPLSEVFSTLQAFLGSAYVNDFNIFGRTYKVMIQADQQFRSRVQDIDRLEVRDRDGRMVPLSTLVSVRDSAGPQTLTRYNLYPSATITGVPGAGFSSGQAVIAMDELSARLLPPSMGYEWSGVTYQQIKAGTQAPFIFGLAIIFVFLFLAAQYESWSLPLAVILSVPLALLGGIFATFARSYDNNVYTQIGIVLLIGLAAKTAILIVEFAKEQRSEGKALVEAASTASRLRFRPLLMTAFSFILGVVPLVIATGAGASSRRALGTAVFGGMLASTILGVFLVPVLYVVVQRLAGDRGKQEPADDAR